MRNRKGENWLWKNKDGGYQGEARGVDGDAVREGWKEKIRIADLT